MPRTVSRSSLRPARAGHVLVLAACLFIAVAWMAAMPSTGWSQPREVRGVALVIGNAGYPERPLRNPLNDARDVAVVLRAAGMDVILRTDATGDAMKEALADFESRLRRNRGVGVFYFSGHGMQSARGQNYLLPVGRRWASQREVEIFGFEARQVLASMEAAGNALNIVILDACRDAPLPTDERSAASRGLARMDTPSGSLIAFATAPGRTASDNGEGRNGLYTKHLLRAMRTPGLRLEDVFKQVGVDVERESQRAQSPEEFMKLRDPRPFYFFPLASAVSDPAAPQPEVPERGRAQPSGPSASAGAAAGTGTADPAPPPPGGVLRIALATTGDPAGERYAKSLVGALASVVGIVVQPEGTLPADQISSWAASAADQRRLQRAGYSHAVRIAARQRDDQRWAFEVRMFDVQGRATVFGQEYVVGDADILYAAHVGADRILMGLDRGPERLARRLALIAKGTRWRLLVGIPGESAWSSAVSSIQAVADARRIGDGDVAYVSYETRSPALYVHRLSTGVRRQALPAQGHESLSFAVTEDRSLWCAVGVAKAGGRVMYRSAVREPGPSDWSATAASDDERVVGAADGRGCYGHDPVARTLVRYADASSLREVVLRDLPAADAAAVSGTSVVLLDHASGALQMMAGDGRPFLPVPPHPSGARVVAVTGTAGREALFAALLVQDGAYRVALLTLRGWDLGWPVSSGGGPAEEVVSVGL